MKPTTMIHNANQIALFFESYPQDEAVDGVVDHFRKFWERRILEQIQQYLADGGGHLHELVPKALERLPGAALTQCSVSGDSDRSVSNTVPIRRLLIEKT